MLDGVRALCQALVVSQEDWLKKNGEEQMSELLKNLPGPLKPEGDWANIFSYHAMDIEVARTEGIYYYDTEGRKYLDASGGPMAFNLPHGHPKMLQAIKGINNAGFGTEYA